MIIFDTETTGLVKAEIKDLKLQPQITEFAAIKLDDKTLEEIDRISFLVKPSCEIEPKAAQITGLNNQILANEKPFSHFYLPLVEFFFGEKYLIAHNISFDMAMLTFELQRLGRQTQFPYPPIQICTVTQTYKLKGYRLNLEALSQHLLQEPIKDAHRAMNDVETLTRCVRKLIENGTIKI